MEKRDKSQQKQGESSHRYSSKLYLEQKASLLATKRAALNAEKTANADARIAQIKAHFGSVSMKRLIVRCSKNPLILFRLTLFTLPRIVFRFVIANVQKFYPHMSFENRSKTGWFPFFRIVRKRHQFNKIFILPIAEMLMWALPFIWLVMPLDLWRRLKLVLAKVLAEIYQKSELDRFFEVNSSTSTLFHYFDNRDGLLIFDGLEKNSNSRSELKLLEQDFFYPMKLSNIGEQTLIDLVYFSLNNEKYNWLDGLLGAICLKNTDRSTTFLMRVEITMRFVESWCTANKSGSSVIYGSVFGQQRPSSGSKNKPHAFKRFNWRLRLFPTTKTYALLYWAFQSVLKLEGLQSQEVWKGKWGGELSYADVQDQKHESSWVKYGELKMNGFKSRAENLRNSNTLFSKAINVNRMSRFSSKAFVRF